MVSIQNRSGRITFNHDILKLHIIMMIRFILVVTIFTLCLSCNNKQSNETLTKYQDDTALSIEQNNDSIIKVQRKDSIITLNDYFGYDNSEFNYSEEFELQYMEFNEILHKLSEYREECPQNIIAYIEDIIVGGEYLPCRCKEFSKDYGSNDFEECITAIRNLSTKLQNYKDKTETYFPKEELNKVLEHFLFEIAKSESDGWSVDPRYVIIFPRLLEIATHLSPTIDSIATIYSTDQQIGVINIDSRYNSGFHFSALIAKKDGVYKLHYLPDCYCANIKSIDYIEKTNNSTKYLLTSESTIVTPIIVEIGNNGDVKFSNKE